MDQNLPATRAAILRTQDGCALNELTHEVIGAAMEVHKALGPGYLEGVYEEAMCIELEHRGIAFRRQIPFQVSYRQRTVGEGRIDLLVAELIVVELKAVKELAAIHTAQMIHYLKVTQRPLGLLINFKVALLHRGIRRVALSEVLR